MNKHYCCTDLHGMYDLWKQIKTYCDDTDKIYFLGDAADRGKRGIKIIQELLTDKRVTYLKGNHEELLLNSAPYLMENNPYPYSYEDAIALWMKNGGDPTIRQFRVLDEDSKGWIYYKMKRLPSILHYVNSRNQCIILSHAGLNPWEQKTTNVLWDRKHINSSWNQDKKWNKTYVVHGHTPVQYMVKNCQEVVQYAGGHKINLDLASWDSKKIALFDLDSLRVAKYFTLDESK